MAPNAVHYAALFRVLTLFAERISRALADTIFGPPGGLSLLLVRPVPRLFLAFPRVLSFTASARRSTGLCRHGPSGGASRMASRTRRRAAAGMADHVPGSPPFRRGQTTRLSELQRMDRQARRASRPFGLPGEGGAFGGMTFVSGQEAGLGAKPGL